MTSIIGAGMAGLLAGAMLRGGAERIIEKQQGLPNNHSAVLRFRSSIVGDALNVPFKKVKVMKAVHSQGLNPVAAQLAYSLKTNGSARLRSAISAEGEIDDRWIAPPNLISQMYDALQCHVEYGVGVTANDFLHDEQFISTMPMPVLMDLLGWENKPEFHYVSGYNLTATLSNVDAYVSLYIPDRERQENRISLTGDRLTVEFAFPHLSHEHVASLAVDRAGSTRWQSEVLDYVSLALGLYGHQHIKVTNVEVKSQTYAKILPIDEDIRRSFIMWASENFNVFSLGRFATWRPGLLLDDIVNDVRVISRLAKGKGSSYDHKKREIPY